MDIGSAVGRKEGLTERQLMELADFEHSDAFDDLEKAVLRFATHLTLTPAEVSDEVFDALRPHFTPAQLVELTSAIAWGTTGPVSTVPSLLKLKDLQTGVSAPCRRGRGQLE